MKMIDRLVIACAMSLTVMGVAVAGPLTAGSSIGWSGSYQAQDSTGTAVVLSDATQIDFSPAGGGTGNIVVLSSSGDILIAGIDFGDLGTTKDFSFDPFAPVSDFLSVLNGAGPDFALDLNTLSIDTQNNAGIVLLGLATMRLDGFDDTIGTYSLSFQTTGNTGQPNPMYTFTFSANAAAQAVPEPGSLALVGAALFGLAVIGRRRSR